ncbi:hypothetical protein, partial [Pantoea agglomerans]|uniref:hypothetical protein n=1 Tax=Enterobacter agglomerans TaxID=549 RepID=UPI001A90CE4E
PSSRPAADGPSGLAIPGSCRPFADVLSAPGFRLFLSAPDASGKPLPMGLSPGLAGLRPLKAGKDT